MAFRGRGRGRGRGFGAAYEMRLVKNVPYDEYPEDVTLPSLPSVDPLPNEVKALIASKLKLEYFWKGSCYHLQEVGSRSKSQDVDIERFSDRFKQKGKGKREALASYLKLTPSNFPPELIQGSKHMQHDKKKLRWDTDEKLFDMFEKLEEKYKGEDEKGKEKKGESEDEEDEEEEAEEETSDDDDYNKNVDFDDDEDDLNMEEEEQEDVYE
ncbi:glutamic acid-rich protein [Canna indica]|uniref:Glutamic acid-rich protein n=1 Tax=Canna indica TaxID=4628 RepID=A0AAQ3KYT8_9LILI|nr:glutamic acid-rich protein [Canna indica]